MLLLNWKIVLTLLGCSLKYCSSSSVCSRTVADSCSQCVTDKRDANQGLQLLIPAWNFTCQGTILKWFAHATENATEGSIEFQIYEPLADTDNYTLVYGNEYQGNSAEGSLISRSVSILDPLLIPIKPGYIVGVYLPPNNGNEQLLELMYNEEEDEGTEVYYWTGIQSRRCQYSLCSGKIKKGLNFLIGWDFTETSLGQLETTFAFIKDQDPSYCFNSVEECITSDTVSSQVSNPSMTTATLSISQPRSQLTISITDDSSITHAASTHAITESSVIAVISASSMTRSNSPTDSIGNSLGISSFQLGLLGGVLILLTIIITLLLTLLIMFTRRKRKLEVAKAFKDPISCNDHVDTDVNPSYRQLTVPACQNTKTVADNGYPKSAGKCFELQTDIYTEIDSEFKETSRKDYSEIEVMKAEEYCVPFSCTNHLYADYEIMFTSTDNKTWTQTDNRNF